MKTPAYQQMADRIVFAALKAKNAKKDCGKCKAHFAGVPATAKFFVDPHTGGYYWECRCKSALYVPCLSETADQEAA